MKLNGKVAWVLGASSGIGAAVARELASRGGTVAISARREEQLHEVSEGHMLVVPLDVTDAASVVAAAARVHEEIGPIDLAVLSAGYWKQMDPADPFQDGPAGRAGECVPVAAGVQGGGQVGQLGRLARGEQPRGPLLVDAAGLAVDPAEGRSLLHDVVIGAGLAGWPSIRTARLS
jgi:NAD(P)-dependent dehydrogenase (short-subunit alcohol dehydrogenase family)